MTKQPTQILPPQGGTPPTPHKMVGGGMQSAISSLIAYVDAINGMQNAADQLIVSFSQQLTALSTGMNSTLNADAQAVSTAASNGGDNVSENVQVAQNQYTDDQIAFQNQMTPWNTQTDNWTDAIKGYGNDTSNDYTFCQSIISIMQNLAQQIA